MSLITSVLSRFSSSSPKSSAESPKSVTLLPVIPLKEGSLLPAEEMDQVSKINTWMMTASFTACEYHRPATDAESELVKGIILTKKDRETIRIFLEQNRDIDFKERFEIPDLPNYCFYLQDYNKKNHDFSKQWLKSSLLFDAKIQAKKTCLENGFNQLVVPHAKMFWITIQEATALLIVEEKLNVRQEYAFQDRCYKHLNHLDAALDQLVHFFAMTRIFGPFCARDLPIIDTDPEYGQNRRIALLDLRRCFKKKDNSYALNSTQWVLANSLVPLLQQRSQAASVFETAFCYGMFAHLDPEGTKNKKLEDPEYFKKLQAHYISKGILEDPCQLIPKEDLSLHISAVIDHLNENLLARAPSKFSTEDIRFFRYSYPEEYLKEQSMEVDKLFDLFLLILKILKEKDAIFDFQSEGGAICIQM